MTSYIGDIPLTYFNVYQRSYRDIRLSGFFVTASERNQLAELCAYAHNASVIPLMGGGIIAQDNSVNKLLIVYCQFDEDQYFDGYYKSLFLQNLAYSAYDIHHIVLYR